MYSRLSRVDCFSKYPLDQHM